MAENLKFYLASTSGLRVLTDPLSILTDWITPGKKLRRRCSGNPARPSGARSFPAAVCARWEN